MRRVWKEILESLLIGGKNYMGEVFMVYETAWGAWTSTSGMEQSPSTFIASSILEFMCEESNHFYAKEYMSTFVGPSIWRPNVIHIFRLSEPGETAAAVETSLSPGGQSIAYQSAYGL